MEACRCTFDEARWHAALPPSLPLQQSWRHGAAAEALGRSVTRLVIRDDGESVGYAQILRRRAGARLGLVSGGPAWCAPLTARDRRAGLAALTRALGPGPRALLATAEDEELGSGGLPLMTGATRAVLSLEGSVETLRRGMAQKWRNRLNAALRRGPSIREVAPHGRTLAHLVAAEAAQRRARGYRALSPAFLRAWLAAGPAPQARLFIAGPVAAPQAAMLFLTWPGGASYHMGWRAADAPHPGLHHAILWHAMRALAAEGCRCLDLGMVDTVNAPGLARFKLGSGAALRRFGPTCLHLTPGRAVQEREWRSSSPWCKYPCRRQGARSAPPR